MIDGRATKDGTARGAARVRSAEGHVRSLGDLSLTSIGLGTYLGEESDAADERLRAAAARALAMGVNVLDTAVNYRSQRSERAIGAALAAEIAAGRIAREEVFVSTKGGYIPSDSQRTRDPRALIDALLERKLCRREDIVAGCHCLAPRYLEDQIELSRKNLGLSTIDLYYLHNPEQQLDEVDGKTFDLRMRAAFETLEKAVAAGKIANYGTATWAGYRVHRSDAGHLSIEALRALAHVIAGDGHHFRAIQLPVSPSMREAANEPTQEVHGKSVTALAAAHDAGLYVFSSRSIDRAAIPDRVRGTLRTALGNFETDAQRALQFTRSLPFMGTALAGMGRVEHVEENLALVKVPPAEPRELKPLLV